MKSREIIWRKGGVNEGFFSSFLQEISRINRESDEDFGQRHEAYKESSRANKF